jgi:hypothetical protein
MNCRAAKAARDLDAIALIATASSLRLLGRIGQRILVVNSNFSIIASA